jgi:tricorn protease
MTVNRLLPAILLVMAPLMATRAALPRFPQPYSDKIVFVADGNVWSVPKSGGTAVRLTSAPGQDMFPRVSPDGKWIAYTEAGKAGTDIWVIPAAVAGLYVRRRAAPDIQPGDRGRHRRPPRSGQHGGYVDTGFAERRLLVQARSMEQLDPKSL